MTTELPSDLKLTPSETQIDKSSSKWLPPGLALQKVDERIMTLNVGPQHPGSGHMRLIVQIDGDYIVACDPDPGCCGPTLRVMILSSTFWSAKPGGSQFDDGLSVCISDDGDWISAGNSVVISIVPLLQSPF